MLYDDPKRQYDRPSRPEPIDSGDSRHLIVGVGISTSGLKAFKAFLEQVPKDSGMAFVLVQHVDPERHDPQLALLARHAPIPVVTATDQLEIEADHVYVAPPGILLTVAHGRLRLATPAPSCQRHRPVDALFESLARSQREYAAGVVLTSIGPDGRRGIAAIRARGGLALAQADHTSCSVMSHSADVADEVHDVLPVEAISERLVAYLDCLTAAAARGVSTSAEVEDESFADIESRAMQRELQATRSQLHAALIELDTTREEAESVKQELKTINAKLNSRNQRLTQLNSDLHNLLASTRIATLFLDQDLRIKSFTPEALTLFQLRDSDCGRPITELVSTLDYPDLVSDVHQALKQLAPIQREVQSKDGATYIMNIRLCRTMATVINGVVITFFDISEHKRCEWQRAWLAAIVEVSRDAIVSVDLEGRVTSFNHAAEKISGYSAAEAIGQTHDALLVEQSRSVRKALERQRSLYRPEPIQIPYKRPDGSIVQLLVMHSAIVNDDGERIGTAVVAHDISDRVAEEQQRDLLVRELSHRVKNVLATVQSVMIQSAESSDTLADFRGAFSKRLRALADTHTELLRTNWHGTCLDTLIQLALRPYGDPKQAPPWTLNGPEVMLSPPQAIAMSMALHELTTNAAKYGALSSEKGRLVIEWSLHPDTDELQLHWHEHDGPQVTMPSAHSFGLRLIKEGLAHELDARVDIAFEPDGLECDIAFVRDLPSPPGDSTTSRRQAETCPPLDADD